jgi:hypothetical protein
MKTDDALRKALWQTAVNDIPENIDLWPGIQAKVSSKKSAPAPIRWKLSFTLVIVLAALIMVATAVYAYYRIMIDPGLQTVENAGKVAAINQTAAPTVFAAVPSQLAPAAGSSVKTHNGITVTLNWAYADENRLALQLSVEGLKLPEGAFTGDFICKLYVSNGQGVSIGSIAPADIHTEKDKPGQPIVLTYISYQHLDASRIDHLDLDMDLTIGACGPRWNFGEVAIPGQETQTPTPPPLIGNYHFNVRIPVYKGLALTSDQAVSENGITIHLETVTLSPSFSSLQICYQPQNGKQVDMTDWAPQVVLAADGDQPIDLQAYQAYRIKFSEACDEMGAPIALAKQPNQFKVIVQRISTDSGVIEGPWVFIIHAAP